MPDDDADHEPVRYRGHEHALNPSYLHPADARVVDLYTDASGDLRVTIAVPCPECDQALELDAEVEAVEEAGYTVPLTDEVYD